MRKGRLTIIAGPMFAGKTTKLITLYRIFKQNRNKVLCFKAEGAEVKNRNGQINSHDARFLPVIFIDKKHPELILREVKKRKVNKVLIDAVHFFPERKTKTVIGKLLKERRDVVVDGLLYDYKRKYFRLTHELFDLADERIELFAVCEKCGGRAKHTERISGGKRKLEATTIAKYIPACSSCHKIYRG